jgi:hypothetical protein
MFSVDLSFSAFQCLIFCVLGNGRMQSNYSERQKRRKWTSEHPVIPLAAFQRPRAGFFCQLNGAMSCIARRLVGSRRKVAWAV